MVKRRKKASEEVWEEVKKRSASIFLCLAKIFGSHTSSTLVSFHYAIWRVFRNYRATPSAR
jgi:hypothetical protein